MQKTTNYNLNQWEATDPIRRADFNADNAAIDAALAGKAEQSAVSELAAKVNTTYSSANLPAEYLTVSTTGMTAGATIYTFSKAPRFVLLFGLWESTVIQANSTASMTDNYTYQSGYTVTFSLSGTVLTLVSRGKEAAADTLVMIPFY